MAATYMAILYLLLVALLTSAAVYAVVQTKASAYLLVAIMAATLLTWCASLFKRREARCPLCKGTPLLNTGAHLHEKAYKLPLLNHGNTNAVRTIFTQRLRCMYCGTPYDFLKPVTDPIGGHR
ncbi:MAG: hypothetical protein ACSHYF_13095 [Verrucomicrobiaceae bacterium]